jgi:hypothetical protein
MDATKQDLLDLSTYFNTQVQHKLCDGTVYHHRGYIQCDRCSVSWRLAWVETTATDDDISLRFRIRLLDKIKVNDEFIKAVTEYLNKLKW